MNRHIDIVAEVANAHQGNPETALEIARAGLEAGADAAKYQVYFADELLVRAHPRFQHFSKQSFAPAIWEKLIPDTKKHGAVYCDVFGVRAVAVADAAGADGYKIHSSDTGNVPLLKAVAKTGKRAFLSAGGTTARELAAAVAIVGADGVRPTILHGFQSYPTAVEDSCLDRLKWLFDLFGDDCDIGYMDHVAGDDPLSVTLPILAMGMGATVIEKHMTLDRAAKGVDYYSSMEPHEFRDFVAMIRRLETAGGGQPTRFSDAERHYRNTVKKHWVAARPLPAGHVLAEADVVMKRVDGAAAGPLALENLLGRPLLHAVEDEHVFSRADVKQIVYALPVARSASSRLPGKALLDVAGMPALGHLFERLKRIPEIDRTVFCTTTEPADDALAALAAEHDLDVYRGPVDDVLGRILGAIEGVDVDVVLRVTGDDILIDADYVRRAVEHHLGQNAEYSDLKELPSGTEVEVFDADLLRWIWRAAADREGTEYLTFYVTHNGDQIGTTKVPVDPKHAHDWRLTLDTPEDYEVIRRLLQGMRDIGKPLDYTLDDIVAFFEANPDVAKINAGVRQRTSVPHVRTDMNWRYRLDGDRP